MIPSSAFRQPSVASNCLFLPLKWHTGRWRCDERRPAELEMSYFYDLREDTTTTSLTPSPSCVLPGRGRGPATTRVVTEANGGAGGRGDSCYLVFLSISSLLLLFIITSDNTQTPQMRALCRVLVRWNRYGYSCRNFECVAIIIFDAIGC